MRGDRVVLDEAHFATDGGDLKVEGRLDGRSLSGNLAGHLDLELVEPLLAASGLQRLTGDLKVELQAGGTLDKPDLRGQVAIVNPVRLRPKDFDRDIVIGSGVIALDAAGADIQNLAVTVDGSTMRFSGRAGLGPGFAPENIEADVDGDVSARLLAFVAPDAVSDAQGRAHLRARLRGTLQKPEIRGRLDLGDDRLSAARPRHRGAGPKRHRRDQQRRASILHNVKVSIGDQGILVIGASGVRAGRVQFSSLIPFKPGAVRSPAARRAARPTSTPTCSRSTTCPSTST